MRRTRNRLITVSDYTDKTLLVLSGVSSGVSLCLFTNVIDTFVGIANGSISLLFFLTNEIVKMFSETIGRENANHRKNTLLSGSKLNSIKNSI